MAFLVGAGKALLIGTGRAQVTAWQQRRNDKQAGDSWRFTTADARIKLKRLYPSIDP